jgi:hypothetical protein
MVDHILLAETSLLVKILLRSGDALRNCRRNGRRAKPEDV